MNNDRDLMQELSAQGAKMTDKELLQEALERLLAWKEESSEYGWSLADEECVEALRARLSQLEQEPQKWTPVEIGVDVTSKGTHVVGMYVLMPEAVRHVFYSQFHPASPQRKWVGLTDDEIEQAAQGGDTNFWDFCRIIEAKLKEKNNAA